MTEIGSRTPCSENQIWQLQRAVLLLALLRLWRLLIPVTPL